MIIQQNKNHNGYDKQYNNIEIYNKISITIWCFDLFNVDYRHKSK